MTHDTTQLRILDAAGAIFAERGFEKATVRDIAARAEVNLASINYHFGDKERLYVETIKHAHRYRIAQAPLPAWPAGTPAETRLRDFIQTTIRMMLVVEGLPWQQQLMAREMLRPSGACREMVEDSIRPHFEQLLAILDDLVPPSLPLPRRHQLGFSIIGQCIFYRFHGEVIDLLVPEDERQSHFSPRQLGDHIADVALATLGRSTVFAANSPSPPRGAEVGSEFSPES